MPFQKNPDGFSPESLGLLDVAMTKLWLQQVVLGASLSGAPPAVQASLHDKVRRLDELGMPRRRTGGLNVRTQIQARPSRDLSSPQRLDVELIHVHGVEASAG